MSVSVSVSQKKEYKLDKNLTFRYKTDVEAFCDAAMAVQKSPGGQTFRAKWGSNRYAANFAFICLGVGGGLHWRAIYISVLLFISLNIQAANAGIKSAEYKAYAASQIDYMLGDNPNNFSYVVGYGDAFPKQPHHKVPKFIFSGQGEGHSFPPGSSLCLPACSMHLGNLQ